MEQPIETNEVKHKQAKQTSFPASSLSLARKKKKLISFATSISDLSKAYKLLRCKINHKLITRKEELQQSFFASIGLNGTLKQASQC